jgi:hypothetical protein
MRKFYILISMLLLSLATKAQISDTLQLSSSQLQYHVVDSFTQVYPTATKNNIISP